MTKEKAYEIATMQELGTNPTGTRQDVIYKAMDIYAEQTSIEFICWAVKNHSVPFEGFSLNFFTNGDVKIFVNHEEITIQQLYSLFKQSQQSK